MEVTQDGFAQCTELVATMARDLCDGRLVSLLEGGYDLDATAGAVQAHLQVLSSY
jgi:acetoin utilization deacetylase AcuC-like enzyme